MTKEQVVENLKDSLNKLEFYNNMLTDIDTSCKSFCNGEFSYEMSEKINIGKAIISFSKDIPKTLDFGLLYSLEDEDVKEDLNEYRELFNINSELISSIEENLENAIFINDKFFIPTLDAVLDLNKICEIEDFSIGYYICELVSEYLYFKNISSNNINVDLLLTILDKLDDEFVNSYIFEVKQKLKEAQSLVPYKESGLEIYQKPIEEKSEQQQISEEMDKELKEILRRANKDVD